MQQNDNHLSFMANPFLGFFVAQCLKFKKVSIAITSLIWLVRPLQIDSFFPKDVSKLEGIMVKGKTILGSLREDGSYPGIIWEWWGIMWEKLRIMYE